MSWAGDVKHPSKVVSAGDMVNAVVLNIDKQNKKTSLGPKQTETNPWNLVEGKYTPGTVIEGKVRNLTEFGAFVGLEDGIDGLIHISDMSWLKHIKHPSEVLKKGQKVQAVVVKVDKEKQRISLSLKQLSGDPWSNEIPEKYAVGSTVDCRIVKIADFGIFVELAEGIEGLIHVSESGVEPPVRAEDVMKIGDEVRARVTRIDTVGEKIAVVKIEGVILDSKDIIEELREHRENKSVKAIMLRIDSPGGAVAPSQEIYTEVLNIRDEGKKKIVTSMGSVAASGGYYIASASDRIVANPGSVTGSIGVILELANVSGLMKKVGVESVVIKSGKFKDVGSLFRTMTTEERELLQGVIDDTYDQFVEAVSVGRGISKEDLIPIADGRVFTGRQAKKLGLVDELGSMQDAIKITADMAGIKGEPDIIEKKKKVSIFERLVKNSSLISWIDTGKKIAGGEGTFSMKYMMAF